ncbi:MAG: hypothetical protein R3C61_02600 [Bacteroidia bacterium]
MKNFFTILLYSLFCVSFSYSQPALGSPRGLEAETEVPSIVKEAFESSFDNAEKVSWKAVSGGYLVSFVKDKHQMEAFFSEKGVWKYTDITFQPTLLKDVMRQQVREYYPDAQIRKTMLHDEQGNSFYTVEIQTGGKTRSLVFSAESYLIVKK